MDQVRMRWMNCGAWDRLETVKSVVLVEPMQRGDDFDKMVAQYQDASGEDDSAVLLAVCRGKLSEGWISEMTHPGLLY